jgi:hypothetical protein
MKIAICFHGLPRLIEKCYPDIYNYFIKNNDVDIFAHFWWDKSHKGKINRLHIKERYDNENDPIETFKSLYKTENVVYEDCPKKDTSEFPIQGFVEDNCKMENLRNKIMLSFLNYTFYCRFKSIKKVLSLVNTNNDVNKYDLIIILRTDLLMFNYSCLMDEIKNLDFNNYLYTPSTLSGGSLFAGEHPNKIGDWFFIGNPKYIIKYFDTIIYDIENNKNTNKNYRIYNIPLNNNFKIVNNIINDIDDIKNNNFITPVHNTERLVYWSKKADVSLNIYNCSISIRRFIVEEWENPNYRLNNMVGKDFYTEIFNLEKNMFEFHDLLPFYTYNITFIK